MLVHHCDPGGLGVQWRVPDPRLAAHLDRALIRRIDPREDLDAGALAGPVLAQQRQHFTGADIEGHVPDGDGAAKPFRRADQPQQNRSVVGRRGGGVVLTLHHVRLFRQQHLPRATHDPDRPHSKCLKLPGGYSPKSGHVNNYL